MQNRVRELIQSQDICVLATSQDGVPHASLMAYAVSEDCTTFFMATYRNTTKFANIQANPSVCLLLDNRNSDPARDRLATLALTIQGRAEIVQDQSEKKTIAALLHEKLPHFQKFLAGEAIEFITIQTAGFLLMQGPTKAIYEED